MTTIHFLLLAMAWSAAVPAAGSTPLPKKLIMTGWDSPDTAQFRRDMRSMEQWPFDGVVIHAQGQGSDGRPFDARAAFNTNHWESTCFSNALADLKAARSDKLTDNFPMIATLGCLVDGQVLTTTPGFHTSSFRPIAGLV